MKHVVTYLKNIYLYKRKSIFFKILAAIFFLSILPISVLSILYMNTYINNLHNETLHTDETRLIGLSKLIDRSLENTEQSVLNFLLNSNLEVTSQTLISNPVASKYQLSLDRKNLSKIVVMNNLLDDVFIYFEDAKVIMTSNETCDFDIFFNNLNKYEKYDGEFWSNYFNNQVYKENSIIPAMKVFEVYGNQSNISKKVVTLIRSLNQFQKNPKLVYGIMLKESEITSLINNVAATKNIHIYITDNKLNILTSTDNNGSYLKFITKNFIDAANKNNIDVKYTLNNIDANIIVVNSTKYNMKYIVVVPLNVMNDKTEYTKNILFSLCIITIILVCLTAIFIFGIIYKPLRRVIKHIQENSDDADGRILYEFEYIDTNITNIHNYTRSLNATLKESVVFSREKLLDSLIKGKYTFFDNNPDILDQFDIHMKYPNFIVYIIKIDNYKIYKMKFDELQCDSYKLHINKLCDEQTHPYGVCFPSSEDEICLIISSHNNYFTESNLSNNALEILQSIKYSLPFTVSIGIGSTKKDIHEISKSYEEAKLALKHKTVMGANEIIEYKNTLFQNTEYFFPIEIEKSIFNYLKTGDYENSVKLLEYIITENFSRNISCYFLQYILSELLNTILKIVYEIGGKIQDIFDIDLDLNSDLYSNETIEEITTWFKKAFSRLCNFVAVQRKNNSEDLINKITNFISDNYNKDITLENVADRFNMSYSYLSRYFKQHTGVNYIDYLYQLRFEKAKEMLKESKHKINIIAETIGFNSIESFFRMFKKYEGITPGKFRDNNLQKYDDRIKEEI